MSVVLTPTPLPNIALGGFPSRVCWLQEPRTLVGSHTSKYLLVHPNFWEDIEYNFFTHFRMDKHMVKLSCMWLYFLFFLTQE